MSSKVINGIINVLKPPGMTSHDVVSFLRRQLNIKKAGHTGTLDPGVAGVLPVCLGKATKIIEYMSEDQKQYRAEVTFGRSTDTQDRFGEVVAEKDASYLTREQVEEAILSLKGERHQVPPMVSALKHKGHRLYELARQGITVERKPRPITIYEARPIKYSGFGSPNPSVLFDIKCSKGTYVRTVCHDLGNALGCGGFMSFLVRTGTGMFRISEALTIEEIARMAREGTIIDKIIPPDKALPFEPVWVRDNAVNSVVHGNRIYAPGIEAAPEKLLDGQLVKLMNRRAGCLAVARVISEGTAVIIQPVKLLC